VGCGTCLEYCVFDAISIVQGKAVHDSTCRGCGRCATRCPENAVRISLDNPNVKDEIVDHISTYVDVT
jgi:UDP-glucose 4-epimerase